MGSFPGSFPGTPGDRGSVSFCLPYDEESLKSEEELAGMGQTYK